MARVSITNSKLIRWLPALIIMGIIFLVSGTPSHKLPNFGSMETNVEMAGHLLGYALLSRAFLFGLNNRDWKSLCTAAILAMLYGVSDEIHQSFVPGRVASIADLGIDLVGILLSLLTIRFYERIAEK